MGYSRAGGSACAGSVATGVGVRGAGAGSGVAAGPAIGLILLGLLAGGAFQ